MRKISLNFKAQHYSENKCEGQ